MFSVKKLSFTSSILVSILIIMLPGGAMGQKIFLHKTDSLSALLVKHGNDTSRCLLLANIAQLYANNGYTIKGFEHGMPALRLAKKLKWTKGEGLASLAVADCFYKNGDTSKAMAYYREAYAAAKKIKYDKLKENVQHSIGKYLTDLDRKYKLAENSMKFALALKYARLELAGAQKFDDINYIVSAYINIGFIYSELSEDETALQQYNLAKNECIKAGKPTDGILKYLVISYVAEKKYTLAENSLLQALKATNEKVKNAPLNAMAQLNNERMNEYSELALCYKNEKNYRKSFFYNKLMLNEPRISPLIKGIASILTCELYLDASDELLLEEGVQPADRYKKAFEAISHSLQVAKQVGSKGMKQDVDNLLSRVYAGMKDYPKAYETYKNYIAQRDSSLGQEKLREFSREEFIKTEDSLKFVQKLTGEQLKQQKLVSIQQQQKLLLNRQQLSLANKEKDLQHLNYLKTQADLSSNKNKLKAEQKERALANATVSLQKAEISEKKTQSYFLYAGIAALLLVSFFIARNYINQRNSNRIISAEKQRSDDLLLNILPADVAEELKGKGSADAKLFDEVTVLFTDFVDFTKVSELLSPQELVNELHYCFKSFDEIVSRHQIEKIKTIGDAYLAVAGLPHANVNHAVNAIKAALEIRQFIHKRKIEAGDKTFDIRIGIHSGSVVAGIVGVKKFAYDIWGDTVNTAARMEQNSSPGRINISEKTYLLAKDQFTFIYRGEINAKNKGAMKMYFAEKLSQAELAGNLK